MGSKSKIGISWKSVVNIYGRLKSLQIEDFEPIFSKNFILFVSLFFIIAGTTQQKENNFPVFLFCISIILFFDIFLLNNIGPHLLVFIFLLVIISFLKKFLFNLSSIKIFFVIIVLLFLIFLFEMIFADIILNYNFDYYKYIQLCIIGAITIYLVVFCKFL